VKQANRVITLVTVLGMALANAGVLHAVHMHQHGVRCSASDGSHPAGGDRSGSHHDPDTCSFCIQFASGNKTVSPDFGGPVSFALGPVQDMVCVWVSFVPSVSLPSSAARAPPSICL
jgi:hypothetical protein